MAIVILLIILLILILAVIFAIQNSAVVPISYLIWDTEGSLAFILLLALIFGALIGLLVSLPTFIKNRKRITKQGKDIAALEATIQEQSTKLEMIEGQLTVDEELPAQEPELEPEEEEELQLEPEGAAEQVEVEEESVELLDDTSPAEIEGEVVEEAGDEEQGSV